jgi:phosphopantetheinyl transferase (holo-ACP synthase)
LTREPDHGAIIDSTGGPLDLPGLPPDLLAAGVVAAGVDLVDRDRLARAVRRTGDPFVRRVLTDDEHDFVQNDPAGFATVFGIKESVVKMLRGLPAGMTLRHIALRGPPDRPGAPIEIRLTGVLRPWAQRHGVRIFASSTDVTEQLALALCVAIPSAPAARSTGSGAAL